MASRAAAPDYDVIVVGAGHNALVSAAYLSQAGQRVAVFERRHRVGGAVCTEELVRGYRFDLGGSAHILIRLTPIADELRLGDYGLEYIDLDPLFVSPQPDAPQLTIYRNVDQTCNHLEDHAPGDGEAYHQFHHEWLPFASAVRDAFLASPGPLNLGKAFSKSGGSINWQKSLPAILGPYGSALDEYFTNERLKALMVWMAAQSGPPPTEPLSAPFVLWHPLYHVGGVARPRGGSGELTQALHRHLVAHGAEVFTSAPVDEIVVQGRKAVGVRAMGQVYTARSVLAGTHVKESLGRLLPEDKRAPGLERARIGNGFGLMLRLALDRPVRYANTSGDEVRIGLQLLCRDRAQITDAYGDYLRGEPASDPPIVAMTFSAVDDTLAPPGGEVLWIWGQYYPYELATGTWESRAEEVKNRLLDTFETYAPGTRESIVGELFQHPVWLEQNLGLLRGNVMHLEMSIDQMFMMRPALDLSSYKTHLDGLYITGASTHPGGGIMGASGRNAATVVLRDLQRRSFPFTRRALG